METGEKIAEVPCQAPTFTVAWHPNKNLLAFAGEDKVKLPDLNNSFIMPTCCAHYRINMTVMQGQCGCMEYHQVNNNIHA